jgi:hypothetical protein
MVIEANCRGATQRRRIWHPGQVHLEEDTLRPRSLVVAATLLASCSGSSRAVPVELDVSTTAGASTLRAGEWTRTDDESLLDNGYQWITDVVQTGDGLVASGIDSSQADPDAVIWVSPDGVSWTRVLSPLFAGPQAQGIHDLALGGPGIVAVGFDGSGGNLNAAVWASVDGTEWIRVLDPGFDDDGDQEIRTIVATDFGFVAAGHDMSANQVDAAVWMSPDGLAWHRVFDPALGGFGHQRIYSIDANPQGLVAAGSNYWPNQFGLFNMDARAWFSEDGISWSYVDAPTLGGPGWQFISAVAAGPEGFVAAGTYILGRPGVDNDVAVWVSSDGLHWSRVAEETFALPGVQRVSAMIHGPEGFVAVGYDTTQAGNRLPAVWRSEDGTAWSQIADPALAEPGHRWMNTVTTGGPGLVAAGADGTRPVGDPAVWLYALARAGDG